MDKVVHLFGVLQYVDQVVDVPVVMQRQVPTALRLLAGRGRIPHISYAFLLAPLALGLCTISTSS